MDFIYLIYYFEKGLRKTYEWYIKKKPRMNDEKMVEVEQVLKIV